MKASPGFKLAAVLLALLTLAVTAAWAASTPGFSSYSALLSASAIVLASMGDGVVYRWLMSAWPTRFSRMAKPIRRKLRERYERDPIEILEFEDPVSAGEFHLVASYLLRDAHGSGLLKCLVHHPPGADPYDVLVTEGNAPAFRILDLDRDGRPELFVDSGVGAHSHSVRVFRLGHLRFEEALGSPQFADWKPVELTKCARTSEYRMTLLKGAGAAGSNSAPRQYKLAAGGLELVE
jgi:hypothetical protein